MKKILLLLSLFPVLEINAQCSGFYDGFESGTFGSPWTMGSGTYTMTVPNTSPAVGTYNLSMSCSTTNSFYQGPQALFTAGQPAYISWWAKTNTTTAANGYFVVGDANTASNNGILFAYFNATSGLRFFASTGYNHPIVANTWYHVEAMNLNWTSRTMDIYVNGVLILSAWPFRSTTTTAVDRVLMHSLSPATVEYDEIIIGTPPVTASAVQSNISCFGGSNGSATVTASGGNGVYTYSWAPSGGTAATASGLTAGTYTCTISDGAGCTGTQTVTITEPSALTASATQTDVSCNGGTNGQAVTTAGGGTGFYTYAWSPSGGVADTASGLSAGTYTCTVTDGNGCTVQQSVTITEPSALQTASAASGTSCNASSDGSAVVTVMGGTPVYTYSWAPAGGTGSTATGLSAGTYTCTITDGNGCTATETVTIIAPPALTIQNSGGSTICIGNNSYISAFTSGGTGSVTYSWQPGNMTGPTVVISPTSTTMYYVTATDSNGCSVSDSALVTVVPLPVVNLGADIVQCGGTVTLDAQNSGSGYIWSTGGNGQTEIVTTSGTVSVSVIDGFGCSSSDTISVTINSNPVVAFPGDVTQCGGTVILDAQNSGASYLWNDSTTAQTLTVTSSGTYYVTVTDSNGCSGSDTANVTINTVPVVIGTASATTVCTDDANVSLAGTPAGGTWAGTGVSGSSFDPSAGTGSMAVIYTYTDLNGCSGSDTINILVNACVGVIENTASAGVYVYPNPNNGNFILAVNENADDLLIEVLDAQGRRIYLANEKQVPAGSARTIALDDAASGFYILRASANGKQQLIRLAIQR
ncbi:MAG: hypothetical protein FD123_195 [Bacteroidetes bacterium]|nr:MAG: hypothetical protein FD123_195 [Bacteroidota bacterium]